MRVEDGAGVAGAAAEEEGGMRGGERLEAEKLSEVSATS
jgi:hypothetical protein